MSWLDVAQAWADQCKEDAAAGRKLPAGAKVRILKASRKAEAFIEGKVGRVEFYFLVGGLQVSFEDRVTREYARSPSSEIYTQTKFAVQDWEPVPEDTPIGPAEHLKVALEWGCPVCWGVEIMTDAHMVAANERRARGDVPTKCLKHPTAGMRLVVPMLTWHARLMEDGRPQAWDRTR